MRIFFFVMAAIVFSVPAYGANWKLYFENRLGDKFYIDTESIHRTPEGTMQVWEKTTPSDDAKKKITIESLYDVDCSRRRFRVLQGTIYGDGIFREREKSDWEYFTPSDLSNALYKTICNKRNLK